MDPDEHKAIVISGFLGHYKTLSMAIERLKISAIGLQISPDMDGSISKLAENLLLVNIVVETDEYTYKKQFIMFHCSIYVFLFVLVRQAEISVEI